MDKTANLTNAAILAFGGWNYLKTLMAKFTVYFKDKAIHTSAYESGIIHIGRDETNDVVVESLAVAPIHAVAIIKNGSCLIKQMNDRFPLLINNKAVKDSNLQDNDIINIGKHYIVFNKAESLVLPGDFSKNTNDDKTDDQLVESVKAFEANLQILEGEHIGRVLPLKKALTRLGHDGFGVVIIARRKEGYFVSALEENQALKVNDLPLGNKMLKLNHNDVIVIDKIPMQFFLD